MFECGTRIKTDNQVELSIKRENCVWRFFFFGIKCECTTTSYKHIDYDDVKVVCSELLFSRKEEKIIMCVVL